MGGSTQNDAIDFIGALAIVVDFFQKFQSGAFLLTRTKQATRGNVNLPASFTCIPPSISLSPPTMHSDNLICYRRWLHP